VCSGRISSHAAYRLSATLAISTLLLAESSCSTGQLASYRARDYVRDAAGETFEAPSMVELLARAPDYEGELIETTGFYGGVITGLFLTRDHAEILDFDSAVHVADPTEGTMREHCVDHYVRVRGILKRMPVDPDAPGLYRGPSPRNFAIVDVKKIRIVGRDGMETTCWPPDK